MKSYKDVIIGATPLFDKILDAINSTSSYRDAHNSIDMPERAFYRNLAKMRDIGYPVKAKRSTGLPIGTGEIDIQELQASTYDLPITGVSEHYKAVDPETGVIRNFWVKRNTRESKEDQLRLARLAVEAMKQEIPVYKPTSKKKLNKADFDQALLNLISVNDYHFAALMHKELNNDQDWDHKIAADTLKKLITEAVDRMPKAATCLFVINGDFFHSDNKNQRTNRSGNQVDQSIRYELMVSQGRRLIDWCVRFLAAAYPDVHVIFNQGNHDEHLMISMQDAFVWKYSTSTSNVYVDDNKGLTKEYIHGNQSLIFYHGHDLNNRAVDAIRARHKKAMANDFVDIHSGHKHHHHEVIDKAGIKFTQHPTFCPADWHSTSAGYESIREIRLITYHDQFGERQTFSIKPQELDLIGFFD